ncbi:hypothetical protein MBLNU230_g0595t1 [Neophaeotheca triangularis]
MNRALALLGLTPRQTPQRRENIPEQSEQTNEEEAVDNPAVQNSYTNVPNIVDYVFGGDGNADKEVLIDPENPSRSITKRLAMHMVDELTGKFEEGSTVCMHISNDVLYPVLYLAILASNAKWQGTNTAYTPSELGYLLGISQASYIITEEAFVDNVQSSIQASGIDAKIIIFTDILRSDPPPNTTDSNPRHETLHDLLTSPKPNKPKPTIDIDAPLILMATSGTTGFPKLAARSHRSIVLESLAIQDPVAKPYPIRRLFCTPIFHAFSSPLMLLAPLRENHTTYIMRRFNPTTFPEYIDRYQITETAGAPAMLQKLCELDAKTKSKLHSLHLIWTGGAPLTPALEQKFLALFPSSTCHKTRLVPVWGMTEGGWFSTVKFHPALLQTSPPPPRPITQDTPTPTTTTIGPLLPSHTLRLLLPSNPLLSPTGEPIGELLIASPTLMTHYHRAPAATVSAFHPPTATSQRWLKTGDLGYYTRPTGQLHLVGRAKEVMKINGFQVSPEEIEAAVAAWSGVRDVGVVGVRVGDAEGGERGVVFVVLEDRVGGEAEVGVRASADWDEQGLRSFLRARLAGYKVRGLEFRRVGALPRSVAGKVLRGELRAMV